MRTFRLVLRLLLVVLVLLLILSFIGRYHAHIPLRYEPLVSLLLPLVGA